MVQKMKPQRSLSTWFFWLLENRQIRYPNFFVKKKSKKLRMDKYDTRLWWRKKKSKEYSHPVEFSSSDKEIEEKVKKIILKKKSKKLFWRKSQKWILIQWQRNWRKSQKNYGFWNDNETPTVDSFGMVTGEWTNVFKRMRRCHGLLFPRVRLSFVASFLKILPRKKILEASCF